jgi:uncharacterized protein YraI
VIATQDNVNVNVRSGPSTSYNRVSSMNPQSTYNVVGRNDNRSWYQINYGSGTGWVASSVTRTGGDCSAVPVVAAPPPPSTGGETQPTEEPTEEPSGDETPPTEEATEEPTEEPTEEAGEEAQLAGNNSQRVDVNIKNTSQTISGAVSYPNGVTSDTVSIFVGGFDSVTTSGNVTYTLTCFGEGTEFISVSGLGSCGSSSTRFYTNDSDTDRFVISLTGGDNAYVNWQIVITANN